MQGLGLILINLVQKSLFGLCGFFEVTYLAQYVSFYLSVSSVLQQQKTRIVQSLDAKGCHTRNVIVREAQKTQSPWVLYLDV